MKMGTKLVFLCIIALLLGSCSDRFTNYYPKYEDAVKDGAVKRGWIPDAVPATATEIYEQHDLDTNDVWIRFIIPNSDRDRLKTSLKILTYDEILKLKLRKPSFADWWFQSLIEQSPANDAALYSDIYTMKCFEGRIGYLAFDSNSQKIYYWCTR